MASHLEGKVALVTGANTGIGRITALELAKQGAEVVLACRSEEKAQPVIDEIKAAGGQADFLKLDLNSFAAVRESAESFLASGRKLHILVNNAGLAGTRGLTEDGFEIHFGVNHLGPFLFTQLLLPRVKESAPARIVMVSSQSHYRTKEIEFDKVQESTPTVTGLPQYEVSKLANVLYAAELSRRLEGSGVTTYSLHPGVVASDIWRGVPWPFRSIMKLFMISNEEGAATTLHCATSDEAGQESGLYYTKSKIKKPSRPARDEALAKTLWEKSEAWVGLSSKA